ncbi:MAG TPA: TlpA disulfide reductase family protein [Rhizobacter sp.]|nr:TlpA disulfide reductase family protein [Rhizobacter sp.]
MKLTRHLAAAIVVLAIGAAAAFYRPGNTQQAAPDVSFTRLDGSTARLAQLRGKVVLVNFWATTCAICVKEMPQMVATHRKFSSRGYETLAVAMSYDPPVSVVSFTESRRLPFTVVIDNTGAVARSFGDVALTPTSVLINKRGEIVKRYVGEPDFAALHQLVEELLAEV